MGSMRKSAKNLNNLEYSAELDPEQIIYLRPVGGPENT